jgi:predicted ATPase
MRTAIPSFSTLVSPLHNLLEIVYARAGGKRTKTAVARVLLAEAGWTYTHQKAFECCQNALSHTKTLSHTSYEKRVCLYTDASQEFWSAIATQVPPGDLVRDRDSGPAW